MNSWKNLLCNYVLVALSISVLLFVLVVSFTLINEPRRIHKMDYIGYVTAGAMILDGEGVSLLNLDLQNIYQQKISQNSFPELFIPFRKFPIVALPFVYLSRFSLVDSYHIFVIVNFLLMFYLIWLLIKTFPRVWKAQPFLFLLPVIYLPVLLTILHGQISLLLALFFLNTYRSYKFRKNFSMGFWIMLMILKTQYLVFVPFIWLLSDNKRLFLFGVFSSLAIIFIVSFLISGTNWIFIYPQLLVATESIQFNSYPEHFFTLYGFLVTIMPAKKSTFWVINALVYIATFLYETFIRQKEQSKKKMPDISRFLLCTFVCLTLCVQVLALDLCILIVPIFIIIDLLIAKKVDRKMWHLLLLVVVLLFILPVTDLFFIAYLAPFVFIPIGLIFLKGMLPVYSEDQHTYNILNG